MEILFADLPVCEPMDCDKHQATRRRFADSHIYYAYLIMIDSITLLASSHLSVTISIAW